MLTCKQCGYEWQPRKNKTPVECPDCKSRKWNKDKNKQLVNIFTGSKKFLK